MFNSTAVLAVTKVSFKIIFSVRLDHLQGAYGDPYLSVTLVRITVSSLKMVQTDRNMQERMHRRFNCKF
jgi:hypothetical protein